MGLLLDCKLRWLLICEKIHFEDVWKFQSFAFSVRLILFLYNLHLKNLKWNMQQKWRQTNIHFMSKAYIENLSAKIITKNVWHTLLSQSEWSVSFLLMYTQHYGWSFPSSWLSLNNKETFGESFPILVLVLTFVLMISLSVY